MFDARRYSSTAALLLSLSLLSCKERPLSPPTLSATCGATPPSGPAPLAVSFTLNVAGAEGAFTVRISYGDGQNGSDVAVAHTYASPGTYTAAFNVSTSSQSALCSAIVQVGGPVSVPSPTPSPTPTPSGNQPPQAVFRTQPEPVNGVFNGRAPFRISFNMCPSSDPEGDPLLFTIDFQGDGKLDVQGSTGADCRGSFDYSVGTFKPKICVTDLNSGRQPAHAFQCKGYTVQAVR